MLSRGGSAGRASSFPTVFIAFAHAPLPERYRLNFGPQGLAWIIEYIQSYVISNLPEATESLFMPASLKHMCIDRASQILR